MATLFIILARFLSAETFCVSTSEGLQAALTTAASNSENDEIQIVQGTYLGNFRYSSNKIVTLSLIYLIQLSMAQPTTSEGNR